MAPGSSIRASVPTLTDFDFSQIHFDSDTMQVVSLDPQEQAVGVAAYARTAQLLIDEE